MLVSLFWVRLARLGCLWPLFATFCGASASFGLAFKDPFCVFLSFKRVSRSLAKTGFENRCFTVIAVDLSRNKLFGSGVHFPLIFGVMFVAVLNLF